MIDSGLFGGRTAEDFGLPGVEVTVEVDHRNLPISTVDRAEQREYDGVVSTEGDDARVMLAVRRDGHERLPGDRVVAECGESRAVEKLLVTVFDLLDGILIVVWRDGNVATVHQLKAGQERVDGKGNIVAAIQGQTTRACSDARWPEAGARAVRGPGVLKFA